MRVFCARPVARMVENVGSTSLVLGLIAMATDVEGLYAGVKALTCVVKTNRAGEITSLMTHVGTLAIFVAHGMTRKGEINLMNGLEICNHMAICFP